MVIGFVNKIIRKNCVAFFSRVILKIGITVLLTNGVLKFGVG